MDQSPTDTALLLNYFATSLARAGDTKSAKQFWKRAAKLAGEATTAQENLHDLRQPPGERWGPAYLDLRNWISQLQIEELRAISERILQRDEDDDSGDDSMAAIDQGARRFLAKYPEVERLIPDMLDRGNADSQQFALLLGTRSQRREMKDALADYVLGPRGTDQARNNLLVTLKEQGHSFEFPVSMFVKGKVRQIEMLSFSITNEPTVREGRSDEACEIMEAAIKALHHGEGAEAERLLQQLRQTERDQPDVLNNLALALQLQDKNEEADLLIDEVIEKYPDYFFGKIAAAGREISRGRYDSAHEILVNLQRRDCFHYTEFFALARMMIYTCVGRNEHKAAQSWLDMLEKYDPDHPDIPSLEWHIATC